MLTDDKYCWNLVFFLFVSSYSAGFAGYICYGGLSVHLREYYNKFYSVRTSIYLCFPHS